MIRHQEVDGPRRLRAEELAETLALCNRVLRPDGPPTIAQEYPRVFGAANVPNLWVMQSEGRIASHAGTYATTLELDADAQLRLGGISSVATEPSARHRGYGSRLVEACCAALRAQGCHFAVLWTEVTTFYERLGFASLGQELLYRLTPAALRGLSTDARLGRYDPADLDAVMALRAAERPYTHRSPEEWLAYLHIPKMQVWVARRNGEAVAYAAVGKGEDFRNCCHEWAGAAADVLALLAHATARSPRRELILLTPGGTGGIHEEMTRLGVPNIQTDLGMFRCLDPRATLAAVRPRLERELGRPLALEADGARWWLRVGDERVGPVTTDTFSALLLGPRKAGELLPVSREVAAALEDVLPLPLFIWGLDSV